MIKGDVCIEMLVPVFNLTTDRPFCFCTSKVCININGKIMLFVKKNLLKYLTPVRELRSRCISSVSANRHVICPETIPNMNSIRWNSALSGGRGGGGGGGGGRGRGSPGLGVSGEVISPLRISVSVSLAFDK